MIQHLADSLTAFQRSRQCQDDHLRHHKEEEHHHSILDHCSDIADLKMSGADPSAAEPVNSYNKEVDTEERKSVQICETTVRFDGGLSVIGEGLCHTLFFPCLVVKGSHDSDARDVLQKHCTHTVKELLQFLKQRRRAPYDNECDDQYGEHHSQQNESHLYIQAEGQCQRDDKDNRYRQDHLDAACDRKLYRCNVGYGTCRDRRCSEMPEIVDGEFQRFLVDRHSHIFTESCREHRAGVPTCDGAHTGYQGCDRHLYAGSQQCFKCTSRGTLV